ncbi:MAG TPA: hypothetical protein VGR61_06005, partial [Candidatus Dormibacteraeota bacterium]|nr:hypothetical protein [Candidatus Dormibacteraeota bacterium]
MISRTPRSLRSLAYPLVLLVVAGVLSTLALSGSSVAAFDGPHPHDRNLVAGTPRGIRSDEWAIDAPYIVSQSLRGLPRVTPSGVGDHDLALSYDLPNRHWSTLFRPFNWPFFVLDLEHAFALRWWAMALSLLLPAYALLLALTQRIVVSVLFSVTLFFSPFFQWWYVPVALVVVGSAMAALACVVAATRAGPRARIGLLAAAAYFLVEFCIGIYPPFQLSTAWVVGALGAGWAAWGLRSRAAKSNATIAVLSAAAIALVAVVVLLFYLDSRAVFDALTRTAYPGGRRSVAGGAAFYQVLGGAFDFSLTTTASAAVNQSELSSFLVVGPWVALQFVVRRATRPTGVYAWMSWPLVAVLALFLAWALLPLPSIIGRLTLLDRVPPGRAMLGIGLASQLLTFLFLATPGPAAKDPPPPSTRGSQAAAFAVPVLIASVAAVASLVAGWGMRRDLGLVRARDVIVISAIFGVVTALTMLRRRHLAAMTLAVAGILLAAPVNPLYRGLSPITSAPIVHAAQRAGQRGGTRDGAVLSYAGVQNDLLVVGSGRPVVNAINLYPNAAGWHALDPSGARRGVWNRYSHVLFITSDTIGPRIRLINQDTVEVAVNPCDPGLDQLHVDTVMLVVPGAYQCLDPLETID